MSGDADLRALELKAAEDVEDVDARVALLRERARRGVAHPAFLIDVSAFVAPWATPPPFVMDPAMAMPMLPILPSEPSTWTKVVISALLDVLHVTGLIPVGLVIADDHGWRETEVIELSFIEKEELTRAADVFGLAGWQKAIPTSGTPYLGTPRPSHFPELRWRVHLHTRRRESRHPSHAPGPRLSGEAQAVFAESLVRELEKERWEGLR